MDHFIECIFELLFGLAKDTPDEMGVWNVIHPSIPESTNKRDLALLALGAFSVAAIAIHTIKNNNTKEFHALKTKTKQATTKQATPK